MELGNPKFVLYTLSRQVRSQVYLVYECRHRHRHRTYHEHD